MSTIAHPRDVPSGPSGTTVAGFLVGAILTVAVGYGVVNLGEPVSGQLSQAAAVARGERMEAINELGFGESATNAAEQAALARTEWMLDINELWTVPSTSSVADFGLDGASHALPEYIRTQLAQRAQDAQYESQIEHLTEQWKAQNETKLNGGPKRPIVVE